MGKKIVRHVMLIVEQLDRATRELAVDHPINSRLALILIDNATELIVQRRCQDTVRQDTVFRRLGEESLTSKQRREAHGAYLEPKLGVMQALGTITEIERRFISICHHQYRNELYHIGLGHQDVVRAVAGAYLRLSCQLFGRIRPQQTVSHSDESVTEVGNTYLQLAGGRGGMVPPCAVEKLADELLAKCPTTPTLSTSLSASALAAIEAAEQSYEFLISENPGGLNGLEVLRGVQFYYDFVRQADKEGIDLDGPILDQQSRDEQLMALRGRMKLTWRPKHRDFPAEPWRRRAGAVGEEASDLSALIQHQALRDDMRYLTDVMAEAAMDLERWIDLQVDIARGK